MFLAPPIPLLIEVVVPDGSVVDMSVIRIATTAIGGVIVIVAGYLLWPSARHPQVAAAFEATLGALARYARDVAGPAASDAITDDRRVVYRRLSDARVHPQRTLSEPPPAGAERGRESRL